MYVVFLGPPGAGKGTCIDMLTKEYNIPHICTGDMLRAAIKEGNQLGLKAATYIDKGKLVPDELVINIVREELPKHEGAFLDGFPRTVKQSEALEKICEVHVVLNFSIREKTIIDRISGRLTCGKCNKIYHERTEGLVPKIRGKCDSCGSDLIKRSDEDKATVRKRLEEYYEKTAPLIDYYRDLGLLVDIDANKPFDRVEEILDDCRRAISER